MEIETKIVSSIATLTLIAALGGAVQAQPTGAPARVIVLITTTLAITAGVAAGTAFIFTVGKGPDTLFNLESP